jgi:hypothetical protein
VTVESPTDHSDAADGHLSASSIYVNYQEWRAARKRVFARHGDYRPIDVNLRSTRREFTVTGVADSPSPSPFGRILRWTAQPPHCRCARHVVRYM